MICKPCGVAGDLVAAARDENGFEDEIISIRIDDLTGTSVPTQEVVRSVAHLYHGVCKGCDCQHRVNFEPNKLIQRSQS